MVAMLGLIMPEPLAMPPTVHRTPSTSNATATSLAKVSVVMMATAASAPPPGVSAVAAAWMPGRTASIGIGTLVTPVDATITWCGSQPSAVAVACAMAMASSVPCSPVHALALPELTTVARIDPCAMCARETFTGGAAMVLVVKTAAAGTAVAHAIMATSGLPDGLMPAEIPDARKPFGAVTPPEMLSYAAASTIDASRVRGGPLIGAGRRYVLWVQSMGIRYIGQGICANPCLLYTSPSPRD